MKINWKVRIKNKLFWVTLIPVVLLLAQQVLGLFGVHFDIGPWEDKLLAIVGTVFSVLATLGVVVDPTTEGVKDSKQALTYEAPKSDKEANE